MWVDPVNVGRVTWNLECQTHMRWRSKSSQYTFSTCDTSIFLIKPWNSHSLQGIWVEKEVSLPHGMDRRDTVDAAGSAWSAQRTVTKSRGRVHVALNLLCSSVAFSTQIPAQ